jgi:hypothetical protein
MYFDKENFKESLQSYTEPLGRIIREIPYDIAEMLHETRRACIKGWKAIKPRNVSNALVCVAFVLFLVVWLPIRGLLFAFYNFDSDEVGWLFCVLFLSLYVLSVPIWILRLALINTKFGLPDQKQT